MSESQLSKIFELLDIGGTSATEEQVIDEFINEYVSLKKNFETLKSLSDTNLIFRKKEDGTVVVPYVGREVEITEEFLSVFSTDKIDEERGVLYIR